MAYCRNKTTSGIASRNTVRLGCKPLADYGYSCRKVHSQKSIVRYRQALRTVCNIHSTVWLSLEEHEMVAVVTVHIGPSRHAPPSSLSPPSVPSLVCYAAWIGEIYMTERGEPTWCPACSIEEVQRAQYCQTFRNTRCSPNPPLPAYALEPGAEANH